MGLPSTSKPAAPVKPKPLDHYLVQLKEGDHLSAARADHTNQVQKWCETIRSSAGTSRITWRYNNDKDQFFVYAGIFTLEVMEKIQNEQRIVKAIDRDRPVVNDESWALGNAPYTEMKAGHWGLGTISPAPPKETTSPPLQKDKSSTTPPKEKLPWNCPKSQGKGVNVYVIERDDFKVNPNDAEFKNRNIRNISLDGKEPQAYNSKAHGVLVSKCAVGNLSGTAPAANLITVSTSRASINAELDLFDAIKDEVAREEAIDNYIKGYIQQMRLLTLIRTDANFENEKFPSVINCSWGLTYETGGNPQIVSNWFSILARYCVIVASAGNEGINIDNVTRIPATHPATITVGACDKNYKRTEEFNHGNWLDIVAPGFDLELLDLEPLAVDRKLINGTSFAAPLTAGIVACMISEGERLGKKFKLSEVCELARTKLRENATQKGNLRCLTANFAQ